MIAKYINYISIKLVVYQLNISTKLITLIFSVPIFQKKMGKRLYLGGGPQPPAGLASPTPASAPAGVRQQAAERSGRPLPARPPSRPRPRRLVSGEGRGRGRRARAEAGRTTADGGGGGVCGAEGGAGEKGALSRCLVPGEGRQRRRPAPAPCFGDDGARPRRWRRGARAGAG